MEGERSRDDRAKGFFENRKFQFLRNQSKVRGYGLKTPEWVGKPLEAIRKITSINCKDVSEGKP